MQVVLYLLKLAQSALSYRFLRGGGIPLGHTQLARLCWGISVAFSAWTSTEAPLWAIGVTGILGAASLIDCGGHGDHQDMGRMRPGYSADGKGYELLTWPFRGLFAYAWEHWPLWARELLDGAAMSWIGGWRGVATVPVIWWYAPDFAYAVILGYSLQGVAYFIGYRIPCSFKGLGAKSPEWGELFTGLFVMTFTGFKLEGVKNVLGL